MEEKGTSPSYMSVNGGTQPSAQLSSYGKSFQYGPLVGFHADQASTAVDIIEDITGYRGILSRSTLLTTSTMALSSGKAS